MNSITLDSSIWVKIGQTFLSLFIDSKRVIVCSESSIVRNDIYRFVQDSAIFFQWSFAGLLQYAFVETLTANFEFIKGDVKAAVCLTT